MGALSETVDIFAKHNISISLINQVEDGKSGVSDACSVIFLTHRALEKDVQAAADMGGLDTVVNNAGISQRSPLLDYTAEEFAKVMDLNVVAVFNGHQAAAKIMTEAGHGGTITTTSSMVAKYGQPSGVGYPTSKFAVNGMVQSLSRELAPMGIRVNAVAPGVTKTDMVANLPEEVIKPIIATIPLGRMGEPEDVANAFVFLASDMSSYVTGAILPVDGAARS